MSLERTTTYNGNREAVYISPSSPSSIWSLRKPTPPSSIAQSTPPPNPNNTDSDGHERLTVYRSNGPSSEHTTTRNGDRCRQALLFLQQLSSALLIGGIWSGAGRNRYNGITGGYGCDDNGYLYRSICSQQTMTVDTIDTVNV